MNNWVIKPIAITLPVLLAGCMSSASNVQSSAPATTTMAKKEAPATMAKADKMVSACTNVLTFASATDDGTNDGNGPANAIDGNMSSDSRWSSKSEGSPKVLNLKLSSAQKIGAIGVAWYKGDERKSKFSIAASKDGKSYTTVVPARLSSGSNGGLEQYKFAPVDAQYIRIIGTGNESSGWNSVVEAKAYGCA